MERKPSRKIIIDFVLIDSDNPTIGYAIHRPGAGKEEGMGKKINSMNTQSETLQIQNIGEDIKHDTDTIVQPKTKYTSCHFTPKCRSVRTCLVEQQG